MSRFKGFTLIELLIVIAIIAVLAAMLFPLVGHIRGKAQATQSVHRIRQCGLIVMQNASENNNFLVIHTTGTSSNMSDLRLHGMVEEVVGKGEVGKLVYTPAYEREASGTWPVWAVNGDDNPEMGIAWERVWFTRGGQERYAEGLRLAKCDSPERYPLLADSSNSSGVPRARFANDNQYKFAMRYRGKGPIFLLDSSTQLVGGGEMAKFGITQGYHFKDNPTTNPTPVSASVGSN